MEILQNSMIHFWVSDEPYTNVKGDIPMRYIRILAVSKTARIESVPAWKEILNLPRMTVEFLRKSTKEDIR